MANHVTAGGHNDFVNRCDLSLSNEIFPSFNRILLIGFDKHTYGGFLTYQCHIQ